MALEETSSTIFTFSPSTFPFETSCIQRRTKKVGGKTICHNRFLKTGFFFVFLVLFKIQYSFKNI